MMTQAKLIQSLGYCFDIKSHNVQVLADVRSTSCSNFDILDASNNPSANAISACVMPASRRDCLMVAPVGGSISFIGLNFIVELLLN